MCKRSVKGTLDKDHFSGEQRNQIQRTGGTIFDVIQFEGAAPRFFLNIFYFNERDLDFDFSNKSLSPNPVGFYPSQSSSS